MSSLSLSVSLPLFSLLYWAIHKVYCSTFCRSFRLVSRLKIKGPSVISDKKRAKQKRLQNKIYKMLNWIVGPHLKGIGRGSTQLFVAWPTTVGTACSLCVFLCPTVPRTSVFRQSLWVQIQLTAVHTSYSYMQSECSMNIQRVLNGWSFADSQLGSARN